LIQEDKNFENFNLLKSVQIFQPHWVYDFLASPIPLFSIFYFLFNPYLANDLFWDPLETSENRSVF